MQIIHWVDRGDDPTRGESHPRQPPRRPNRKLVLANRGCASGAITPRRGDLLVRKVAQRQFGTSPTARIPRLRPLPQRRDQIRCRGTGRGLYVAMTRAKDDLHLVVPQRFFTHGQNAQGDRHVYASRTRFIPDELLGLFESTTWPNIPTDLMPRDPSQGVRIDVAARMRGMWR